MRPRLKPLERQTIVITGGSSGNGLATAQAAVAAGAAVVIAARNAEALDAVAADLRAVGGRVATCAADVALPDDLERIAETAIREFGGFDSWVNNAASATYGRIEDVPLADHKRIFDVNYFGLVEGCRVAARHLRARGGGAIVNVGSVLSDRAMILQGAYSATKHAVQAATDAMRMELERDGAPISVTLVKPGSVDTPYPEHARNYMDAPPRLPPPLYDPALVADAILFACAHPRRTLYVGGGGLAISVIGQLAPRLTDLAMELLGGPAQRQAGDAGDPARRDNLFAPRADGAVHGGQSHHVRRSSLLLEAQKHPWAIPFLPGFAALRLAGRVAGHLPRPTPAGRRFEAAEEMGRSDPEPGRTPA
jgi:NAD(P)-dependent dehydrogenase (short-subunit alcohol dehydrogenase family)